MDRQALAAGILKTDGMLLLIVAAIHFAATPFALRFVASQSTPEAFAQLKPPFLLSFILLGVLLLPIALSTIYAPIFSGDVNAGHARSAASMPSVCSYCRLSSYRLCRRDIFGQFRF